MKMKVLNTQITSASYVASAEDFRKEILNIFEELKEIMEQPTNKFKRM